MIFFVHHQVKVAVQGFSEIFEKLPKKNSVMESMFKCCRSHLLAAQFSRNFLEFSEDLISRAAVNDCL